MSKPLSQDEISQLLDAIAAGDKESLAPSPDTPFSKIHRHIKPFDFKNPDKFLQSRVRELSNASEDFIRKFQIFLETEYGITAQIHLAMLDQYPFKEFARVLLPPSPICTFEWMGGAGALQLDAEVFLEGILGNAKEKRQKLNGLETRIFMGYFFKPFAKILQAHFSKLAEKVLPDFSNQKFYSQFCFRDSPIQDCDMGAVAIFFIKIGQTEGELYLFLNAACLNSLNETSFFKIQNEVTFVPLAHPRPNTLVEIGRFHLEDGDNLKENLIYETNRFGGEPLLVSKNGKYVVYAEASVIDGDRKAVRLVTDIPIPKEKGNDSFLNTSVIFGGCTTEDHFEFSEGCIVPLNENIIEPVKIIKNDTLIGLGEIVIVDENFCVKVTKVMKA